LHPGNSARSPLVAVAGSLSVSVALSESGSTEELGSTKSGSTEEKSRGASSTEADEGTWVSLKGDLLFEGGDWNLIDDSACNILGDLSWLKGDFLSCSWLKDLLCNVVIDS